MRNLKKVLSLVLCLAMMLSVMVVGAGAAFTDQDKIVNTEAVDVCVALNIINGFEDGSYRPEGDITRAQACKMICIALNGGKDPVLGTSATPTFVDIDGHWAEAYIEYCVSLGIVAGVGDGKFDPDGKVTGSQFAKMLLIALGYNAEHEKFLGAAWDVNVNVVASTKNLYEGLESMNPSLALTRDNAAQMLYNALNAYLVKYEYTLIGTDGNLSSQVVVKDTDETLLNDTYGAYRVEGIVVGNEYADLNNINGCLKDGKTDIVVTNYDEFAPGGNNVLTITNSFPTNNVSFALTSSDTFSVTTGADELGKAVVLYVKPAQASKDTSKAEVIGSVFLDTNNVLEKMEKWDDADDMKDALKDAGLKNASTLPASYYVNGNLVSPAVNYNTLPSAVNVNGYYTQFIDYDDDDVVDIVLVDKVDFGKVNGYSTKDDGSITLSTGAAAITYKDSDDVVGFADVAKGDYVLYAEVGGRLYVEKADSITGILTDYSKQAGASAQASLWVDGEKYDNSGAAGWKCDSDLSNPVGYKNLDKEATFYFDACGYIVAVDGTAVDQYALVTYANPNALTDSSIKTNPRATTYFEDGTSSAPVFYNNDDSGHADDATDGTGYKFVFGTANASLYSSDSGTTLNTNYAKDAVLGSYEYNSDDELILDTTGVKTFTPAASDVFKYTAGNVLVETKTSGGTVSGYLTDQASTPNRVYMTDSTVLYVVETENNDPIATTKIDDVKTYVGKDTFPNIELTAASASDYLVKYFINSNNEVVAMAVITGDLNAVGSNYLYAIKVVSSSKDTKQVMVALDGEIQTITVNSKDTATVALGINTYQVEPDGNYKLTAYNKDVVANQAIERKNENTNTIVINGIEYKVTDKTVYAHIDDEDTFSFDELERGDIVTVLYEKNGDIRTALGIYVMKDAAVEAPTTLTAAQCASTAAIKELDDGIYKPVSNAFDTGISSSDINNVRIFKFTASGATDEYKLDVKDEAGVLVYTETGITAKADGEDGAFWICLNPVSGNIVGTLSGSWSGPSGHVAPTGIYYVTITNTASAANVVFSGSFAW